MLPGEQKRLSLYVSLLVGEDKKVRDTERFFWHAYSYDKGNRS